MILRLTSVPALMDEATQKQMDPYSIDLSFFIFLRLHVGLACGCVLMQIQFFGRFTQAHLSPRCD